MTLGLYLHVCYFYAQKHTDSDFCREKYQQNQLSFCKQTEIISLQKYKSCYYDFSSKVQNPPIKLAVWFTLYNCNFRLTLCPVKQ